ncbi:MAG TPA: expansin EXLX1 family cellulose-binding protein [Myxococcota bacterium]
MSRSGGLWLLLALAAPGAAGASEVGCPARMEVAETQATWFESPPASGACSLPLPPTTRYAALSFDGEWEGSAHCGRCLRVTGPLGEVTVIVTDVCDGCPPGSLDLAPDAFAQIANPVDGIVPIAWETVACDVGEANMQLMFEGSHQWYLKVQVQQHRHGIAAVWVHDAASSAWTPMQRTNDFHFSVTPGRQLVTPLAFRIQDVHGQVVETQEIAEIVNDTPLDTGVQLQPCPEPGAAGVVAAVVALAGLGAKRHGRPARRL